MKQKYKVECRKYTITKHKYRHIYKHTYTHIRDQSDERKKKKFQKGKMETKKWLLMDVFV